MDRGIASIAPDDARSLLSWWAEAGVDWAIAEEPRNWLNDPAPAMTRSGAPESIERTVEQPLGPAIPDIATLEEFHAWIATGEDVPLARGIGRRALPHGPERASVMLIADAPGAEDLTEARPLGGDNRKLAQRMMAAIGVAWDELYSASLCTVHLPGQRLSEADLAACTEMVLKQIALVQPKSILLLGDGPSRALLGKSLPQARGRRHQLDGTVAVATFHPRHLIHRPADKRLAWLDLLLLTETEH